MEHDDARPDFDGILRRYAELDDLIERAIERCHAKDAPEATRLAAGVVAEMSKLDEVVRGAGIAEATAARARRRPEERVG